MATPSTSHGWKKSTSIANEATAPTATVTGHMPAGRRSRPPWVYFGIVRSGRLSAQRRWSQTGGPFGPHCAPVRDLSIGRQSMTFGP